MSHTSLSIVFSPSAQFSSFFPLSHVILFPFSLAAGAKCVHHGAKISVQEGTVLSRTQIMPTSQYVAALMWSYLNVPFACHLQLEKGAMAHCCI